MAKRCLNLGQAGAAVDSVRTVGVPQPVRGHGFINFHHCVERRDQLPSDSVKAEGQLSRRDHAMPLLRMCFAMCVLAVCSGEALAIDSRVRSACERDYLIYCSRHDPDGPGVRRCMRTIGERLSTACLNALVAAGEVSKREIAKRSK